MTLTLSLSPYFAAEMDRLRGLASASLPVSVINTDQFVAAEEKFQRVIKAHPELLALWTTAWQQASQRGLPNDLNWPKERHIDGIFSAAKLAELGEKVTNSWARIYGVDAGAVTHRVEVAGVCELAFHASMYLGRGPRERSEGAAYLTAMREFHAEKYRAIEEQEWWASATPDVRKRAAYLAGETVREASNAQELSEENARRTFIWAGRNVAGIARVLAQAPAVVWRTARENAEERIKQEARASDMLPGVDLTRPGPPGRLRAKLRGPVSVAVEGLGFPAPADEWLKLAADAVDRVSNDQIEPLVTWAYSRFAERIVATVARYAVLDALVKTARPPYAAHLARCPIDVFIREYTHLDRSTRTGRLSPETTPVIFWSAIARGWRVAWNLVPGVLHQTSNVEFSLQAAD